MRRFFPALAAVAALLLIIPVSTTALTRHVKADGTGDAPTIQGAVDLCASGDTVLVAPGTYRGDGNRDVVVEWMGIAILAESATDSTVIDCEADDIFQHGAFLFKNTAGSECSLEGITIIYSYGYAVACDSADVRMDNVHCALGGANAPPGESGTRSIVDCADSDLSIHGCTFNDNHGTIVVVSRSTVHLDYCELCSNSSSLMFCLYLQEGSRVTLENSTISHNSSCITDVSGPGILSNAYLKIRNCRLTDNRGTTASVINFSSADSLVIEDTEIMDNRTDPGYACIKIRSSPNVLITGSTIAGNDAHVIEMGYSTVTIEHTAIYGNQGWWDGFLEMYYSQLNLNGVTWADNGFLFLVEGSHVNARNSIFAFNSITTEDTWIYGYGTAEFECCNVYGNGGGDWVGPAAGQDTVPCNFSADPIFCDPENDEYTLHVESPCMPGNHPGGCDCGIIGALGQGCDYVATLLHSFDCDVTGGEIVLTWRLSASLPSARFELSRQERSNPVYEVLPAQDISVDNPTYMYRDGTGEVGRYYRYRIDIIDQNDRRELLETDWIQAPGVQFALYQNYPNPFNPSTTIRYSLPEDSHANLKIYDVSGALVKTLADGMQQAGVHQESWDGRDDHGREVSSGVYFYRLTAGRNSQNSKLVLLK